MPSTECLHVFILVPTARVLGHACDVGLQPVYGNLFWKARVASCEDM